jgi:hypothetical protein
VKLKTTLLLFGLIFCGTFASAQVSLNKQKLDFESALQNRLSQAIVRVIPESDFTVNVIVELKPIRFPKAQASTPPKYSFAPDESEASLLALSKLGIWVPPEVEKEVPQVNPYEQLEQMDLFKNASLLQVDLILDAGVSKEDETSVMLISKKIVDGFKGIKSSINLSQMNLKKQITWLDWVKEFNIPIGFFLSAFLLFFLGLIVVFRFSSLEKRKLKVMEADSQRSTADSEASRAAASRAQMETVTASTSGEALVAPPALTVEGGESGIARLRSLVKSDIDVATYLVRLWIRNPSEGSGAALMVVPSALAFDSFQLLLSRLNEEERRDWKRQMGQAPTAMTVARAENFISSQIIENMLAPPPLSDAETKEALSGMSPQEVVDVAKGNPGLGAYLANVLATPQVAQMMTGLPEEVAQQVLAKVPDYNESDYLKMGNSIQEVIKSIRSGRKTRTTPFTYKSIDLIRDLGPSKERMLFDAIANTGNHALLIEAAKKYFPADLVLQLPDGLLKVLLTHTPPAQRAELLAGLDEPSRVRLLKAVGETGKLREILDFEVEQIGNDSAKLKRAQFNRDKNWGHFVAIVRGFLAANQTEREISDLILDNWIKEKTNGAVQAKSNAA